jgi:hypothetical protein
MLSSSQQNNGKRDTSREDVTIARGGDKGKASKGAGKCGRFLGNDASNTG